MRLICWSFCLVFQVLIVSSVVCNLFSSISGKTVLLCFWVAVFCMGLIQECFFWLESVTNCRLPLLHVVTFHNFTQFYCCCFQLQFHVKQLRCWNVASRWWQSCMWPQLAISVGESPSLFLSYNINNILNQIFYVPVC